MGAPSSSSPEVWDYIQSVEVAGRYDGDHEAFPLFALDTEQTLSLLAQVRAQRAKQADASEPLRVLDLGCGTGRTLIAVAETGAETLGLDLSPHMLERAAQKVTEAGLEERVRLFRGDLACLSFLDPASVDLAVCLYATLGLLRGHQTRLAALRNLRRILRPGAPLLVHVHNRAYPAYSPRHWVRLWRSFREARRHPAHAEYGDLYFDDYAGAAVRRMFMHTFSQRELRRLLQEAGYRLRRLHLIHPNRTRLLTRGPLRGLRSHGFFAIAERG